jgi:hypothetical protein
MKGAVDTCTFCSINPSGAAVSFDLSTLPLGTWSASLPNGAYTVTSPCGQSNSPSCGLQSDPMTQSCKGLGSLANTSLALSDAAGARGFTLTLRGGFDDPPMPSGRNAVYHFVCDSSAPASNPPNISGLTEAPGGFYNVEWRHAAACGVVAGSTCGPPPPVPPPVPPPSPCSPGADTCLPKWTPTWGMRNSTVLYTCNNTGFHSVVEANKYGVVVYDWSNGKAVWANAHPVRALAPLAPLANPFSPPLFFLTAGSAPPSSPSLLPFR